MNGFHLAHQVAKRWPDIGVLVASGRAVPSLDDFPESATFIRKSFSTEVVHARLHEILPEGRKTTAAETGRLGDGHSGRRQAGGGPAKSDDSSKVESSGFLDLVVRVTKPNELGRRLALFVVAVHQTPSSRPRRLTKGFLAEQLRYSSSCIGHCEAGRTLAETRQTAP